MPSSMNSPVKPGPPDTTERQTRELVLSATSGSALAFHRLADLHQPAVFRMIYHRVHSRMDAEDLAQDVFLKAYRHLHKLKTPHRFRSWIFSIALNRIRDYYRQQRLRRFLGLGDTDSSESDPDLIDPTAPNGFSELGRREFWDLVAVILKKMSATEREVFMLRFIDQQGLAEIAHILNKGVSTVKTHLYRAIAKFKAHPASSRLKDVLP